MTMASVGLSGKGTATHSVVALVMLTLLLTGRAFAFPGVLTNVPTSSLTSWSLCYSDAYANSGTPLAGILASCSGAHLLLACRPTGSTTLSVVAHAPRADVLFDTGTGNTPHNANGVGWYFNGSYSWGFAPQGDAINRGSCDTLASSFGGPGPHGDQRLCWHTGSGNIDRGWRCGTTIELNGSTAFERVIFQADTPPCGNGVLDVAETCDDGDLDNGDGCDAVCQIEPCYTCSGEPSACSVLADGAPCNDGLFCNGGDTCISGSCGNHDGNPCSAGTQCNDVCNEAADNCFVANGSACLDDGNPCTSDRCNGAGACTHPNNNFVPCNDGSFCTGVDSCFGGTCSIHSGDPCAGNTCNDLCDEASLQCLPSTSGTTCFEDGNECTTDQCDGLGNCAHPTIPVCSTRTRTPTRTQTATRTRTPSRTATPTGTAPSTPTVTLTPRDTPTPTPQSVPASLVLDRVRLKANASDSPGVMNGTASVRGVVHANPPFDGLEEEIPLTGVSLRIAGGGGVEMTLSWPAASCGVRSSNRGARIICEVTTATERRKLKLRPTEAPNVYSLRVVAKQLGISSPRSAAPVRVVLITPTFARQDDIFACTVSGAQARVSVCAESGVVATPTPAPPLGDRVFSVVRPGSALLSSIVGGLDVSLDPFLPTTLLLRAGTPDVDGVATLELVDDAIVGLKIVSGQTLCMKIHAAGSHGRIDCDGGSPFDTLTTWDSNGAGPPTADYVIDGGLGSDAGPGAAGLFAGWNAFLLNPGSTVADCNGLSYFGPGRLDSFTTATSTGTFIHPVQGGAVSVMAQGQNFDCATWTQEDGVGRILTPLLATETIVGDVVNTLVLADAPSTQVPQVPTPTATPTSTPN